MKFKLFLSALFALTVLPHEASVEGYYHPNEDPDRLISCQGLLTKINTLMIEIDRVNQNMLNLNKRQWTTVLRRQDGSVDFYRNWTDYRRGFGNAPDGEFFIGLDKLHEMTTDGPQELMVVLKDWNNEMRYAHYDLFQIGGEDDKYVLSQLGKYSGDAGDSLLRHKGMKFSTCDQDNDDYSGNCAKHYKGGWWFANCRDSHLAGPYRKENMSNQVGVEWYHGKSSYNYSYKFAEMMIRPKFA